MWPSPCGIISVAIRNNRLLPESSPLCTCAARPTDTAVAPKGRARAATAIVTAKVADSKAWASWWRGVSHPPPATWSYTFEDFTAEDSADEWALAAAIFIAQYRRRHQQGPTFRELFEHLLPDSCGVPAGLPVEWDVVERRAGNGSFRGHVAIEWRRRGYIGFEKQVTRSLRVGHRFRERSRELQRLRATGPHPAPEDCGISDHLATDLSLSSDAVISLLRIAPRSLRRLTDGGFLHSVRSNGGWLYPVWQFASGPNRPVVPGTNVVASAMPEGWSLSRIHEFMSTPRHDLTADGIPLTPVQWLMGGKHPQPIAAVLGAFG